MSGPDDLWERVATLAAALPKVVSVSLTHLDLRLGARIDLPRRGPGAVPAFRIGANVSRLFAFSVREGEHAGVYLRSLDPKVTADPRFFPCRGLGWPTNWVRLSLQDAGLAGDELGALVVESHRLTLTRNEGVPPRTAYGDVHRILMSALDAASPEERPPPPYHAGGPTPKLPLAAALRIAIACAEHVAKLVPDPQRDEYERVLALTRKVLDPAVPRSSYTLAEVSISRSTEARALHVARRAAYCAMQLRSKPDEVGGNAELTAEYAVQALHEAGDTAAVRAFLETLDDWILVAELQSVDAEMGAGVRRVLWRAANEKGFAAAWLVRFDDGSYGLRHKVKTRFAWFRGSRDDVLASVPDASFDPAVRIALDRDVAG
jgi:hypothetical protein